MGNYCFAVCGIGGGTDDLSYLPPLLVDLWRQFVRECFICLPHALDTHNLISIVFCPGHFVSECVAMTGMQGNRRSKNNSGLIATLIQTILLKEAILMAESIEP